MKIRKLREKNPLKFLEKATAKIQKYNQNIGNKLMIFLGLQGSGIYR